MRGIPLDPEPEGIKADPSVNLPLYDAGNRFLFSGNPVDTTFGYEAIQGQMVYFVTFRQGNFTFSIPFAGPDMIRAFANKMLQDAEGATTPSGLYVPGRT